MDWSSITRYQPEIAVLLGFVLLLNPFAVSAFDIGDPDWYRYESSEVTFYDNGTYDYEISALGLDSEVACFEDLPSRSCVIERAIHANGGITYAGPPGNFIQSEYDYVHIWEKGFFKPATTEAENDSVRYGLEAVPTNEALRYVATPLSRTSPGIRAAITDGQYETSDELEGAHELVRAENSYYVVYPAAYHTEQGERTTTVIVLQWLLGALGAWLILRGQRRRVERE